MDNVSGKDYFDKFDPDIYLRRHAHMENSRHMKAPSTHFQYHHFNFVVKDLEGRDEEELLQRKQSVRNLIKGFAECDITQYPPIEDNYNKHYDVVIASYVLESVATTNDEYVTLMSRVSSLVKPGGYFLLYGVEHHKRYIIGDHTFYTFPVSSSVSKDALEKCGFSIITTDKKTQKTAHYMFFLYSKIHVYLGK